MNSSKIVAYMAGLLYPFCLIFGLYVVTHGHLTPGGGFQGGAVMATGVALMVVANRFSADDTKKQYALSKWLETFGLILFLSLAFLGLIKGGAFFQNTLANAGGWFGAVCEPGPNGGHINTGGTVPLMNIAVGVEVLGGISIILFAMLKAMKQNIAEVEEDGVPPVEGEEGGNG